MDLAEQRVTTDLAEQRVMAKLAVAYFVMNFRMFKHHFPNIKDGFTKDVKRYYLSAARDCISAQYRGDYEKQCFAYEILLNIIRHNRVNFDMFQDCEQFIVCKARDDIRGGWNIYVSNNHKGKYPDGEDFSKLTKFGSESKFRIEIPVDEEYQFGEFQGVIRPSEGKTKADADALFFAIEKEYSKFNTNWITAVSTRKKREKARRIKASKKANDEFTASVRGAPPSSVHPASALTPSSLAPLALAPLTLAPLALVPPAPPAPLALAPLALAPLAPSASAPSASRNKKAGGYKRKGTKRGKKAGRKDTKRKR